jgi:hypothetical protein
MYQLLELVVLLATASLCIGRELTGPPPDERAWLRFLIPPTLYLLAERLVGIGLTHPRVVSRLPPRTPQLKRMFEYGYTRLTIFWFVAALTKRPALEDVFATACCSAWGVILSFHATLLADSGSHRRLAEHCGFPLPLFSALNLLVHGMPCVVGLLWPPLRMHWWHGAASVAVHLSWGLVYTGGTFMLDEIYVPLRPAVWRFLWAVSITVELLVPWVHPTVG